MMDETAVLNEVTAPPTPTDEDLGILSTEKERAVSTPTGQDPNAPRHIMIPIYQKTGIYGQTFNGTTTLPANTLVSFYSFQFISSIDGKGNKTWTPRTANEQAMDAMRLGAGNGAVDFLALSPLSSEDVKAIWRVLQPKSRCEKYPELGNKCATCWAQYLAANSHQAIADLPENLQEAATKTSAQLLNALAQGRGTAESTFRESVSQVESKKKFMLSVQDRINMRHCHLEEPNFSGVLGQATGLGAEIAKGIQGMVPQQTGVSIEDITKVVADAVAPLQETIIAQANRIQELEGRGSTEVPQKASEESVPVNLTKETDDVDAD